VLDYVDCANLTSELFLRIIPDGQCFTRQEFAYVTPGVTNNGASIPSLFASTEWMAGNTHTIANPMGGKYSDLV